MPMTTTHALVPLAAVLAFSPRPVPWRLVIAAALAAALPDVDWVMRHFFGLPGSSIYSHRGASHSLFTALVAGVIAACLHAQLKVSPLTAGVAIAAAMASHGILDMFTDAGRGVAYLWPVSSARLFADWRPIYSGRVHTAHLLAEVWARQRTELWQLIVPMFALALAVRAGRLLGTRARKPLRR
jgi:inner membrane protein